MAKTYKNCKDFLIIEMTPKEAIECCKFGCIENDDHVISDDCTGDDITNEKKVYYICVLNFLVSKTTLNDFIAEQEPYEEDRDYERYQYDKVKTLLNIED